MSIKEATKSVTSDSNRIAEKNTFIANPKFLGLRFDGCLVFGE